MKTISRRQFIHLSAAAGMGALLTIISPRESAAGQAGDRSSPLAVTTWPPASVPRGQTLIYDKSSFSGNGGVFNPLSPDFDHQTGTAILYEPCAFYNVLGDKTVLWLAESYQYNDTATKLTIIFRSGIQWSDGVAFTAEDAAWTINKLRTVPGLNRGSAISARVISAEALDSRTLELIFNQTDWRFFFNALTFHFDLGCYSAILPKHIFSAIPDDQLATMDYFDLNKQWPVSTGAYGVSARTTNYEHYDLRPTWWATQAGLVEPGFPQVKRLRTEKGSATPLVDRLGNNEIDTCIDLPIADLTAIIAQNPNVTTWSGHQNPYGSLDWWPISLHFNTMIAPYDDKRVRWAIAYAIDQQAIVDEAFNGASQVVGHPFPEFPRLIPYINHISGLLNTYNVLEQNLTKTETLMTAAGFHKDQGGYWVNDDDKRPDATLYAPRPIFAGIDTVLVNQLQAAGFDATAVSPDTVWSDMAKGTAPLFLWGHGGAVVDPMDTFNLYRPENALPIGQESWNNMSRWSNAAFTAIADQMALISPDDPNMLTLFQSGMAIWLDNLPDCPLIQWIHHIPLNTKYWVNWPSAANPYMNPALWHLNMEQVVIHLKMNLPYQTYLPAIRK